MTNEPHVLDSLPDYVLGLLDEGETRALDGHLMACLVCRRERDAFQAVAGEVALAAPDAAPAPGLKSRLVDRVRGAAIPHPAPVSTRRLVPLGLGLVSIVLLTLSIWLYSNSRAVLTGPQGMRAVALQGTDFAPGAGGIVIVGADGRNGALIVDQLPQLDESQQYQIWLVRDSERHDAGVFSVDEFGYRGARLAADESLFSYTSVWVTVEPAGGSPAPTGDPVLEGSLHND